MGRPRKVKEVEAVQPEVSVVFDETPDAEVETFDVNVKELKKFIWNSKISEIQDAVAKYVKSGDDLTMSAVESIMREKSPGIASQYLQQIVTRNDR